MMAKTFFPKRMVSAIIIALAVLMQGALWAEVPKGASEATKQANAAVVNKLSFSEKQDFADAERGRISDKSAAVISDSEGNTVWDMNLYKFLDGDQPIETINPSLRRQAVLNNNSGLFQVTDRVYQVRGYDLANMGIIAGDTGYIIIDPLTSAATAKAAIDLVYRHLGRKPVVAVIYSHSHGDHWAGVKGVISDEDVEKGKARVIAPAGFLEDAVSENIYAGNAMIRRGQYMYGIYLPRGPAGQVGAGLGKSLPGGMSSSLIRPTELVVKTGQEITVDGVRIVFQLTPRTEAPACMNFYLPQFRALYMADNCVATVHNLLTPRGAQIRDARGWARFLYEAIDLFGDKTDVVFLGHTWPRRQSANVKNFMSKQADLYKYIHDQTLRLVNQGLTPREIAEALKLPDELSREWFNRGYYASVAWDAKAVYQYYLGWYDGNPANINPLPPAEAGKKYVEFMGGASQVLANAKKAYDKGEYRWVAEVVNHVVFADPANVEARLLQADALEQLGYQEESAVFRNFYLTGARELRNGVNKLYATVPMLPDVFHALTLDMIFNSMAISLNGPKAAGKNITVNWTFTDTKEQYVLFLRNSVLNYTAGRQTPGADVTIRLSRPLFADLLSGNANFLARVLLRQISYDGDIKKFQELMSLMDQFDPWFNIVTP